MQYQISYLSPNGHTRKLAESILKILPEDTAILDLEEECENRGQLHLIGFEMNEASIRAVPYRIMELLNMLEHQDVVLFVTSPFRPDAHVKNVMEHRIEPFIPETCRYRGLYLCIGQASDALLNMVRAEAEKRLDDVQMQERRKRCEQSVGPPDENELLEAQRFVAEILGIRE